jgi:hypothetical protein
MFYTIYKITNITNNKIYIGKHQTENLEDGYFGSGNLIKAAIRKYGKDKFVKEILYVYDSEEQMNQMEMEIVTEEFTARLDTYNIKPGGEGGWKHINSNEDFIEDKLRGSKIGGPTTLEMCVGIHDPNCPKSRGFKDKTHSDETKKKIGKANSEKQTGPGNSQYGTCWIYNEEERKSKKINKSQLNEWLESGWIKGRKMFNSV